MKVILNLSTAPTPRERYALAWAVPVGLLGCAGLIFLCVSATRNIRDYREIHRDRLRLQNDEAALSQTENDLRKDLGQAPFRDIFRKTQFLNTLIGQKRFSLTELAVKVTKLLPADVRLTGLAFSQPGENSAVRIGVEGKSEEAVESFLTNLEDSPDFKDVAITNQGFEAGGSAGGLVIITCTALYLGGGTG